MHVVGRLAVWADGRGLPREPGVWMRSETIDAFVLVGCAGMDGSTVQTYRSWLRRVREALVWVQRGEAPPARFSSPRQPQPPYDEEQIAGLRFWAAQLPGQACWDGLALMALGAGCGLAPGEIARVRGNDIRVTDLGHAVMDKRMLGRVVACRARWETVLAEVAERVEGDYVFRPGRKVDAAKNLISSWPRRHTPPNGLPPLSARRLRSTWIVNLLAEGVSPTVVADAAGMTSPAALSPYHHWVPPLAKGEVFRLLRGRR
ncbi:hypothetical protein H180DRAFT_00468 [Streptomyces sp. WMMB 322]|nr:hypothetical protein H180DRAFT_00468 [Streptomyces sp. WMMB 322]